LSIIIHPNWLIVREIPILTICTHRLQVADGRVAVLPLGLSLVQVFFTFFLLLELLLVHLHFDEGHLLLAWEWRCAEPGVLHCFLGSDPFFGVDPQALFDQVETEVVNLCTHVFRPLLDRLQVVTQPCLEQGWLSFLNVGTVFAHEFAILGQFVYVGILLLQVSQDVLDLGEQLFLAVLVEEWKAQHDFCDDAACTPNVDFELVLAVAQQ